MHIGLLAGILHLVGSAILFGGQSVQAGRSCALDGVNASDGETFVIPSSGPCIKYLCNDGSAAPSEFGCQGNDGKCYKENDTYSEGCFRYKCQLIDGYVGFVTLDEGCEYSSTCVPVNGTVNIGCQKYQCIKEGDQFSSSYSFNLVESGCSRNGQCKPIGDSYVSGCLTRKCSVTNGAVGYVITGEGCQYKNGCYNVGTTFEDGCTSYLCSKQVNSTTTTYSLSVQQQKCEDVNHQCHDPGTRFPYAINGVVYQNCTCERKAGSPTTYRC